MLFCNIDLLDEKFETKRNQYVGVKNGRIAYIGASAPEEDFGERYDGRHRLLMPAFYNVHSHAPMTLLRGYAENLPLQRWLGEKVFPFEDQIDDEAAYYGTLLAISEMLASGTASFSDMYFFFGGMVPAILESGIKCNLSRGLTVFDRPAGLPRQRAPARRVERREQRPSDRRSVHPRRVYLQPEDRRGGRAARP